MADGEKSVAQSDYEKKFNRGPGSANPVKNLKEKEATGGDDASWKTSATGKKQKKQQPAKKGKFRFMGRHGGKIRQGSAFGFIIGMLALGVWYTSVFAPNILLVNIKEMYTNDLADATIALNTYYWKMMNYKIGRAQCGEKQSIKCKLSTMSRAQKKAFEKHGFTVLGAKVQEDNRDDFQPGNDLPEQRYQVAAIIPPVKSPGFIATGDMLWLYAQLSSANKSLVYNVFNPKSSFYMDTRFKQRIKSKYGLDKSMTVGGRTEQAVNRSFDSAVRNSGGGINIYGRPDEVNGISLGALSNPVTAAQLIAAMAPLAAQTYSYVGLQCAWYSFGKAVTNNAKAAKHATVARFAMQYLKAADQIKAGTSEDVVISTLSSKLAQGVGGGYTTGNATDSSMYKSIVYGALPIPSIFGLLYYLDTFDLIAAMLPAWSQIMASAAAQGTASKVPGALAMPPANLTGSDREYCLGGETLENHTEIKNEETECVPQVEASAPPGWQGALAPVIEVAQETCPPQHWEESHRHTHGEFVMQPSLKATATTLSTYVAGLFSVNVIAWANVMSLLFTSQTKGIAASDAIFAGTGEILGDMAQSRGMMPSNVAFMTEYLAQKESVDKEFEEVARYNARQQPFDIYNKFSFLGSIVHSLNPAYDGSTPLFGALSNGWNVLASSIRKLSPTAEAFYYSQPIIPEIDPLNPAQTGALRATGLAKYMLRFHCPDPEYLAIMITADAACNVRYSLSRLELAAQIDTVLDYMTQTHADAYEDKIAELEERLAQADVEDGDAANIERMLLEAQTAAGQPFIDKITGKAIPNSEYDKFLQYCVNRADPWGRSAIHVVYQDLPDEEKKRRHAETTNNLTGLDPSWKSPYERIPIIGYPAIVEGAKADQDWYSGKKCLEQSEMLTNFRAYTMACSVDGSLSGGVDCTDNDNSAIASYSNSFYTSNDILFLNN